MAEKQHSGLFYLAIIVLLVIGAFILVILFIKAFLWGFDEHFDNQNKMLCNSAKVSKNPKYLELCKCYYEGKPVRCINVEVE